MSEMFDRAELMDRVDNDAEFLADTVEMLGEESPALFEQLRAALASGDPAALATAAHTLKGMLGNFCAEPAREAAAELEALGRAGGLDGAAEALDRVERLTTELDAALRAFVAEVS